MTTNREFCAPLHVGARIWFEGERLGYTVQARSDRFIVCNKPFNARRTVLYCIIDIERDIRGPENLVFGSGAETREQCEDMVRRLEDTEDFTDVSHRRQAPLRITRTQYTAGLYPIDRTVNSVQHSPPCESV